MTTILVDRDLCTRCGICSGVCVTGVIDPADEHTLPQTNRARAGMCIGCGHCEAYCPAGALVLADGMEERARVPAGAATIAPDAIGNYLKRRRSVRFYSQEPVPREEILGILDIARYAASAGNGQPVEWTVIHDPQKVHRIAGLAIGWMRTLAGSDHPMSGYIPHLIAAWERGEDVICRGAPHLLVAHIPGNNPMAQTDAIIAMTHVDIAAPAFGIGTCWAGFVAMATAAYPPLQEELGVPAGRKCAYAMMFGYPQYKIQRIPRKKPLRVTWR